MFVYDLQLKTQIVTNSNKVEETLNFSSEVLCTPKVALRGEIRIMKTKMHAMTCNESVISPTMDAN